MDGYPIADLGLASVTLSDRARFEAYFRTLNSPLSDYTFAQLFTWGNSLRILWKEIHGHLCVFANGTGDLTLLMPPIGDTGSDRALAEAFEIMDAYNRAKGVPDRSRVEYVSEELLTRFDQTGRMLEPMGFDYVYETGRMIDLPGGDLASKRQLKNRFMRNYEHRVEAYDSAVHLAECKRLLKLWRSGQDGADHCNLQQGDALKRHKEALACELTLEAADALGLKGMVVYVKQPATEGLEEGASAPAFSLRGFTFGEVLNATQSSILIEKTDLGVKGLAQFIFSEFCRRDWSNLPLVNAGDDWGLESLAWTKMSYRPVRLLHKFTLRSQPRVVVSVAPEIAAPSAVPARRMELPAVLPVEAPAAPAAAVEWAPAELQLFEEETVVIRRAVRSDLPAALQLERACFQDHQLTKRQLGYLQSRPSAVFLVAEEAGALLGQGIALVRQHRRGLSGRIYSLSVATNARGRGIGKKLLRQMLAEMEQRGVTRVYLEVDQANAAAIRLYERLGFHRIGLLPDYYGVNRPALHMMYEAASLRPMAA